MKKTQKRTEFIAIALMVITYLFENITNTFFERTCKVVKSDFHQSTRFDSEFNEAQIVLLNVHQYTA